MKGISYPDEFAPEMFYIWNVDKIEETKDV